MSTIQWLQIATTALTAGAIPLLSWAFRLSMRVSQLERDCARAQGELDGHNKRFDDIRDGIGKILDRLARMETRIDDRFRPGL